MSMPIAGKIVAFLAVAATNAATDATISLKAVLFTGNCRLVTDNYDKSPVWSCQSDDKTDNNRQFEFAELVEF